MSRHAENANHAEHVAETATKRGHPVASAHWWMTAAGHWKSHAARFPEDATAARLAQSRCWRRAAEAAERAADAIDAAEPRVTQAGGAA